MRGRTVSFLEKYLQQRFYELFCYVLFVGDQLELNSVYRHCSAFLQSVEKRCYKPLYLRLASANPAPTSQIPPYPTSTHPVLFPNATGAHFPPILTHAALRSVSKWLFGAHHTSITPKDHSKFLFFYLLLLQVVALILL